MTVSELRVTVPVMGFSPVLETVAKLEEIHLQSGEAHLLEVVFNEEKDGAARDLRPGLPLIIRW